MDPTQTTDSQDTQPVQGSIPTPVSQTNSSVSVPSGGKEGAPTPVSSEHLQVVSPEIELPPEVVEAGVEDVAAEIALPPDIQKLGVTPTVPPVAQVVQDPLLASVKLPISDDKVVAGLHAQIGSAFLWLSTWCVKQLKRQHIALKIKNGKVLREKIQKK